MMIRTTTRGAGRGALVDLLIVAHSRYGRFKSKEDEVSSNATVVDVAPRAMSRHCTDGPQSILEVTR